MSTFTVVNPAVNIPIVANTTWETKSLGTYATIPSGSTCAVLELRGTSTTGSDFGFEVSTDSTDFIYPATGGDGASGTANSRLIKFLNITSSNDIKLYLSNKLNAGWYLRAFTDHINWITTTDLGATSGSGTKSFDLTGIVDAQANNGSVLIEFNLNMKVGVESTFTAQAFPNKTRKGHVIAPLVGMTLKVVSAGAAINAGDIKILGWIKPEAYTHDSTWTARNPTSTSSVFEDSGYTSTTVFDAWRVLATSDGLTRSLRRGGDTSFTLTTTNCANRFAWADPSATGLVDLARNSANVQFVHNGGFVADTAAANITGVSTFVAGATATVTFNKSVTTVTKIRATCAVLLADGTTPIDSHYIDITSFSGSGTTRTFTVPQLTNNTDGIRLGAVILTPTTDGGVGADFTGVVYSKTNYLGVNIEDVLSDNVCEGDTPSLSTNNQIAYDSTTGSDGVDVHGIYSDPTGAFIGTQTMWHYAADFKWYSFTVTSTAPDTTPDAFTFGSTTGANLSTVTVGPTQATISGVGAGEDIAAIPSGGLSYRVSTNGGVSFGSWETGTTNVQLGYVIEARVTSSASYSTLVTGTLTVGGTPGTLQVTTRAPDTTPNAFTFGSVTNIDVSTVTVGPTQATIAGVDAGVNISAVPSGGLSYRVSTNGGSSFGSWETGTTNVQLGYVIEARVTSSASYSTLVTGTLTVGGTPGTLQVTTKASAVTPDSFTFAPVTHVTPGAIVASPTTVTVTGVTAGIDIPATASGGLEYRVSSDGGTVYGAWTSAGSNVRLGYKVQVRMPAPLTLNTLATGTFTMGGISGDFTVRSWSSSGGAGGTTLGMSPLIMEPF